MQTDPLRAHIRAALERNASACLDVHAERERVIDAILLAVRRTPEAVIIRTAFANAPDGGQKLIMMRTMGGKREADVLEAAGRLAGSEPFDVEQTDKLTRPDPEADLFADLGDGEG